METKGFLSLNIIRRYQLYILFQSYMPCRSAHFSRKGRIANISRKAAGSQQREGACLETTGAHWGINVAPFGCPRLQGHPRWG